MMGGDGRGGVGGLHFSSSFNKLLLSLSICGPSREIHIGDMNIGEGIISIHI